MHPCHFARGVRRYGPERMIPRSERRADKKALDDPSSRRDHPRASSHFSLMAFTPAREPCGKNEIAQRLSILRAIVSGDANKLEPQSGLKILVTPCGHNAPDRPGASTQLLF